MNGIKDSFYLLIIFLAVFFCSCSKGDENEVENGADLMEDATVYEGPVDGGIYTEAQTSITLLWENHSLYLGSIYERFPHIYISNVTDGEGEKVAVYECELTSVKGGGLNAVIFDFSKSGVTQTPGEAYGTYNMVSGDFEITIPMGIVESASVSFNPEQKIRFSQKGKQ